MSDEWRDLKENEIPKKGDRVMLSTGHWGELQSDHDKPVKELNKIMDMPRRWQRHQTNDTKIETIIVFANMNIAAFDTNNGQIPELQRKSVCELIAERAEQLGYDMNGVVIKTSAGNWRMHKVPFGEWRREPA